MQINLVVGLGWFLLVEPSTNQRTQVADGFKHPAVLILVPSDSCTTFNRAFFGHYE